jgi:hemoglobin
MTQPNITVADIEKIVRVFYSRIRLHPVLGPIFLARIPETGNNWPEHEAKIASFWSSVILKTRSFSGNPMQTHAQVPAIQPEHFDIWLGLFDTVLDEQLPPDQAQAFSELAHRIGRSLRMGIEQTRAQEDIPNLGS